MRIAQVAPLHEAVPPRLYGGTERVVSYLTDQLAAMGHDVTLFASGDSVTQARLEPCCERALRLDPDCVERLPYQVVQLERLLQKWHEFDVIHFHCDHLHFPWARRSRIATVTTLHGRLDLRDSAFIFREFPDIPVVSVSNAQRQPIPWLNWMGTVHHGLPPDIHRFRPTAKGGYLAFLGRLSPEKRADRAIEIARRSGLPLKIAAKVDKADEEYFQCHLRPLIDGANVELIGEIGDDRKGDFLGNARALLFPIDWPEPFGLVMIEAMACGTPVIAWPCGSVSEVVENGVNGYVVNGIDEAVAAVRKLELVSRLVCRRSFEQRFSAERMARDYLGIYRSLRWNGPLPIRPARTAAGSEARR